MSTKTESTTAEIIAQAFEYWDSIPALVEHTTERNLRDEYRGHWFDAETLRFFGSRNRELVSAGLMVELQTKAPDAEKYTVVAWVVDHESITYNIGGETHYHGRIVRPKLLKRFTTRRAAVRFAEEAARVWEKV